MHGAGSLLPKTAWSKLSRRRTEGGCVNVNIHRWDLRESVIHADDETQHTTAHTTTHSSLYSAIGEQATRGDCSTTRHTVSLGSRETRAVMSLQPGSVYNYDVAPLLFLSRVAFVTTTHSFWYVLYAFSTYMPRSKASLSIWVLLYVLYRTPLCFR